MKNIISVLLSLLFITVTGFAQADHYDGVLSTHRQCLSSCEQTKETALGRLSCNYYGTRSALASCENRASSAFRSCSSSCQSDYTSEKKVCRSTKRMEKRACRIAKREEKQACKGLSGKEKRACKKQARIDKRDCKKGAREQKRICLADAETELGSCRSSCRTTRNQACTTESAAAQACETQARPIFQEERQCRDNCDDVRDRGLEGYSAVCPNQHSGTAGTRYTFINGNDSPRYVYRPEPFPTQAVPLNSTVRFQTYKETLQPGGSYVQLVPAGISIRYDFKDVKTDGSNHTGGSIAVSGALCETVVEQTIVQSD